MPAANRRADLPIQTRLAPIGTVNVESRVAEVVWTTGARVRRYDWSNARSYLEELSLQPAHVRMERLKSGAPLLNSHGRWDLSSILGVVEDGSAKVDGLKGTARVRFSERADVEPIFQDVVAKIVRNVSCGYAVHRYEILPADEKSDGLPIYRATDWEPMEISLVPIGADAGAGVRSEQHQQTYPCEFIERKDNMENEDPGVTNRQPSDNFERTRVRTILDLCERHKLPATVRDQLIDRGVPLERVRQFVLEELASRSEAHSIRNVLSVGAIFSSHGGIEERTAHMAEALSARYGGPRPSDQAREFVNVRLVDMARMCLEDRGIATTGLAVPMLVERAMSTSDFPNILALAGNKMLLPAYQAGLSGAIQIARKVEAPDFKMMSRLRLGEFPTPKKVLEGGEFTHGGIAETKESYKIDTFGRITGITRQAIINDDLGAFMDFARNCAIASAAFVRQMVADLLVSNPALSDTVALFHADHKNLAGSNGAIGVDTLGAGFAAMRRQKGLGEGGSGTGVVLNIEPKYLLVPATKETLARQYTSSAYTPAKNSDVNPWGNKLEVIVDPRLDDSSTTAWYLAADANAMPVLEYAYLSGFEGPRIETRFGFNVDALEVKLALDFGCGVVDYKGMYKNAGA